MESRAAGAAAGVPEAAYVELRGLTPDDEAALGEWLADPAVPKAAHDAKSALHALRGRGWTLHGLTSDTALAAYLSRPGQRSFDLADLALRHLRRELRLDGETEGGQLSLLGGEEEADAARANAEMVRASAVAELATALDAELAERGGTELLAEVELPLQGVLADLETAGIAVDHDALAALEAEFGAQVKQAAQDAYSVIGKEINLGSPKQLQVVLFDELGMPKTKRTKTGYTTDADALQTLFEQTGHAFLSAPAGAPGRHPAQDHRGGAAQVGGRRRAHPHHLQPDHRGHRAAVLHRAEPAERADPHRGRAADPGELRRRARATRS